MFKTRSFQYLLLVMAAIFAYGRYRCEHHIKDPLQKAMNVSDLDGWSVSHVVCYCLLTTMNPQEYREIFLMGVLWEAFEWYSEHVRPSILDGWGFCSTDNRVWWYGKVTDILCNAIGILIGLQIAKRSAQTKK